MTRVLVGSAVRQIPRILAEFLHGLSELQTDGLEVAFDFINDNVLPQSSELLRQFQAQQPRVTTGAGNAVCESREGVPIAPSTSEQPHTWTANLVRKVAAFKDRIIREALHREVDFLFLVDSRRTGLRWLMSR